MHSWLITGGDQKQRLEYIRKLVSGWKVNQFDQVVLPQSDVATGIGAVREFISGLKFSPQFSPYLVGIITAADRLTVEAQNALLKTLEEPPPKCRLFLETESPQTLLATIISRCQIITLGETRTALVDDKLKQQILSLISLSPGRRMELIDELIKSVPDPKNLLQMMVVIFRNELINHPQTHQAKIINRICHRLLLAKISLNLHLHPTAVFDAIFTE